MKTNSRLLIIFLYTILNTSLARGITCADHYLDVQIREKVGSVLYPFYNFPGTRPTTNRDFEGVSFWSLSDFDIDKVLTDEEEAIAGLEQNAFLTSVVYVAYTRTEAKFVKQESRIARITQAIRTGMPLGEIDESARRFDRNEWVVARRLSWEGHNVKSVPNMNHRAGDAKLTVARRGLNSVEVEFKTPQPTSKLDTILDLVTSSLSNGGQSPYLVVNATENKLSREDVIALVQRLLGKVMKRWDDGYPDRIREIRILSGQVDRTFVLRTADSWFGDY